MKVALLITVSVLAGLLVFLVAMGVRQLVAPLILILVFPVLIAIGSQRQMVRRRRK